MDITWEDAPGGNDGRVITITMSAGEDPLGILYGMVLKGRLESFLTVLAAPQYADTADRAMVYHLLRDVASVHAALTRRREHLELLARDRDGQGWGSIATATEEARSTVRDRIIRLRREYAAMGISYGTPPEDQ
ncbi:hypothetical protein [Actinomadura atramentaria]|uniref:hypothetical protein n=1 Tax=Actinomadura atramentaria TaxID=1990 RepID=UPI0012F898DF|nr:hypothetical protein [Actinomadura atramentaria]